ncbi:myelin expression factor 2 isoform X2 [Anastrepha obliqua]|uniref:myelin expression factor 2 isoform X2 n=1 Tax=Anastrepha ludens TaxID=28586 RepID=UPI0023AFD9D4|nr:myelin expression factor 2 isoform X2 [Anastrepha ludens]XP_054741541.1 myelin expression factor 2 isoform X2 [Anastrepha obliqua]
MKSEGNENSNDSREKERDRRGRGARASRFSDADASGGGSGGAGGSSNSGGNANRDRSRERRNCRVYISNIPYDYRWQDLKDLFRRIVGSVEYVELFHDENGKARGCGIVEFKDPDNVEKALEKMNRYEINGRELVVKEDHGEQRDQYGRIVRDGGGSVRGGGGGGGMVGGDMGDRDRGFSRRDDDRSGRNNFNMMSNDFNNSSNYNLYGLSASFLESLGISGPLHNKVFVANLDYKVDTKKLKQVFKLAGKVQSVDLSVDKEGNSRGFAVVEYDHPVEAVQAISMLDRQMLFDRRMTVRLDRIPDKGEGLKLPEGLGGVGIGLGPNGEPLKDVARNLPSIIQQQQNQPTQAPMSSQGGGGSNILGNLSSTNLAALSNVVGGLGAALSNPLLTTSLSNLGLNLGQSSGGNDDSMSSANAALSNNYSTGGNNYPSGFGSSGFNSGSGGNTGGGGGFNAYNTGSGNSGGGGGAMDGNDYSGGGGSMDMYVGGGSGGGNAGNVGNNPRKSDTIIIKNIPLSCTWQTLRDKFRDVGEVKFAEIRGNDLGVVRFFKERDAELAIALMDGSRMDGRTIKVTYF